jgi:hypothetical protein
MRKTKQFFCDFVFLFLFGFWFLSSKNKQIKTQTDTAPFGVSFRFLLIYLLRMYLFWNCHLKFVTYTILKNHR